MPPSLTFTVTPNGPLRGKIRVPGDKSISHRSVIFGSIAEGASEISGFLEAADTLATVAAFRALGVSIEGPRDGVLRIEGVGLRGLEAPGGDLDLGNSGTAMRLIPGVLAAQSFSVRLVGDTSLSRRPMARIMEPLAAMGAHIDAGDEGTPPLTVRGRGGALSAIRYRLPVASAQVKSCLLLAALYAEGTSCIAEPVPTRDHTERMLETFGHGASTGEHGVCVTGGGRLTARNLQVPGDISSAAFFLVGASITPGSDLTIENVGVNPTRTGVLDILRAMGADIQVLGQRQVGAEPVADLRVRAAPLRGVRIPEPLVSLAIDEFPVLFVAAALAEGETRLTGARELRVKESDRIAVMADGLTALGVDARPTDDGMIIVGGDLRGARVASHGDHRIAMAFAMAGLRARGSVVVTDCDNVATSFPGFAALAASVGLGISESP
jgi:3-phosphoshikimate 1-carboxyvinyltransferase